MKKIHLYLAVAVLTIVSCQKELSVEPDPSNPNPSPVDSPRYELRLVKITWWSGYPSTPGSPGLTTDTGYQTFEYSDSMRTIRMLYATLEQGKYEYYSVRRKFNNAGYVVSDEVDFDTIPTGAKETILYVRNSANRVEKATTTTPFQSYDYLYSYASSGINSLITVDGSQDPYFPRKYIHLLNPAQRVIKTRYIDPGATQFAAYDSMSYDNSGSVIRLATVQPEDTFTNKSFAYQIGLIERDYTKRNLNEVRAEFGGKDYQTEPFPIFKIGDPLNQDRFAEGTPIKSITVAYKNVINGVVTGTIDHVITYTNTYDTDGNLIRTFKTSDHEANERIYLTWKKVKVN